MRIEHIAIWVSDLEKTRLFYEKYFSAKAGPRYENPAKAFRSYFLEFASGCRLELMQKTGVTDQQRDFLNPVTGLAHFAVSTGSREAVDRLTEILEQDGYTVAGRPRTTGDGYYESVVLDPEDNVVEITV